MASFDDNLMATAENDALFDTLDFLGNDFGFTDPVLDTHHDTNNMNSINDVDGAINLVVTPTTSTTSATSSRKESRRMVKVNRENLQIDPLGTDSSVFLRYGI